MSSGWGVGYCRTDLQLKHCVLGSNGSKTTVKDSGVVGIGFRTPQFSQSSCRCPQARRAQPAWSSSRSSGFRERVDGVSAGSFQRIQQSSTFVNTTCVPRFLFVVSLPDSGENWVQKMTENCQGWICPGTRFFLRMMLFRPCWVRQCTHS